MQISNFTLKGLASLSLIVLFSTACGGPDVTQMSRDQHLEAMAADIARHGGLDVSIRVVIDPKHSNAYCTERGDQWYIGYNQSFFSMLSGNEIKAVLAHEIGHLVNRHVTKREHEYEHELAADKWAGFVLYKMGISLMETISLWGKLSTMPSPTHPASEFRIAKVTEGWQMAEGQDRGTISMLHRRIQGMQRATEQKDSEIAQLRTEKGNVEKERAAAMTAKWWVMVAGIIMTIVGLGGGFGIGRASGREGGTTTPSASMSDRLLRCFGPHTHDNPLCVRVWAVVEPLLRLYKDNDQALESAAMLVFDEDKSPLSPEDRKGALRILMAA